MNVAEAVLLEPALHGSMTSVDELLDQLEQHIIDQNPTPETWGTGPLAEQANRAMEEQFPSAAPPDE